MQVAALPDSSKKSLLHGTFIFPFAFNPRDEFGHRSFGRAYSAKHCFVNQLTSCFPQLVTFMEKVDWLASSMISEFTIVRSLRVIFERYTFSAPIPPVPWWPIIRLTAMPTM